MADAVPQTPKSVLESKTFWGMVLVLAAPAFAQYNVPLPLDADTLAQLMGAVLTIYGRVTATQGVKLV